MLVDCGIATGNITDRCRSGNPLDRPLMGRFLATAGGYYRAAGAQSVLEVGAGEGDLAAHLSALAPARFVCTDLSTKVFEIAQGRYPGVGVAAQSATRLGFPDNTWTVLFAEVR